MSNKLREWVIHRYNHFNKDCGIKNKIRIIGPLGCGKTYIVKNLFEELQYGYIWYDHPLTQKEVNNIIEKGKFMNIGIICGEKSQMNSIIIDNYNDNLSITQFKKLVNSVILSPIIFISSNIYSYKKKNLYTLKCKPYSISKNVNIILNKIKDEKVSLSINLIKYLIQKNNFDTNKTISDCLLLIKHKNEKKITMKKYKKMEKNFNREKIPFLMSDRTSIFNHEENFDNKLLWSSAYTTKHVYSVYLRKLNDMNDILKVSQSISDSQLFTNFACKYSDWNFCDYASVSGTLFYYSCI